VENDVEALQERRFTYRGLFVFRLLELCRVRQRLCNIRAVKRISRRGVCVVREEK
jgi:hypothetical protein